MELCIKHIVLDALTGKHLGQKLGNIDGDRTYQHGLTCGVSTLDLLHNSLVLFSLGLVYRIIMIHPGYRFIGGDLHHVHTIDVPELLLLCKGSTCHARLFIIFIEEILEGDVGKSHALALNLDVLLGLDSLVQTVGVAASRHDTSGKAVYDKHLVILYHIVLIAMHQVVGTERKDHIVLDLQILRVCQVVDLEEVLDLFDTLLCEVDHLVLFTYDEVSGLLLLDTHDGINLGKLRQIRTPL